MAVTIGEFLERLEASDILDEAAMTAIADTVEDPSADAEEFVKRLHTDGDITGYQAQALWKDKGRELVLGNYVVMEELGRGGMGVVLKARHRRMQRNVAIKLLPKSISQDDEANARFRREVRAAAQLHHPNIVGAHDADEIDGQQYLVMQLVDGPDLGSLVRSGGPLPVEQAVDCVLQAARGLEFAHEKGVIHRDVKPANMLLDSSGTIKILDLGLARFSSAADVATQANLTGTGTVMGTIDYMSPEQAADTRSADARSDVYSLGITLFFLLTARPPYTGHSLMARLIAHADHPIPSLPAARPEVGDDLQAVFEKMVAKKPDDRFQSMSEVVATLETISARANTVRVGASAGTTSPGYEVEATEVVHPDVPPGPTSPPPPAPPIHSETLGPSDETDVARLEIASESTQAPPASPIREEAPPPVRSPWRDQRVLVGVGVGGLVLFTTILLVVQKPWNRSNATSDSESLLDTTVETASVNPGSTTIDEPSDLPEREVPAVDVDPTRSPVVEPTDGTPGTPVVVAPVEPPAVVRPDPPPPSTPRVDPPVVSSEPSPWDRYERVAIDSYELKVAGNGDPAKAPEELVAILGDSLLKHWSPVEAVAFSPDESAIASGGRDGTVMLSDAESGHLQWTMRTPAPVTGLAFTPDGLTLIVATADQKVRFRNVADQSERLVLPGAAGTFLALDGAGSRLVTAAYDGSIRSWDVESGKQIGTTINAGSRTTCLALSRDGRTIASGRDDGTISLWNVATGELEHSLTGPGRASYAVAFSPDGRTLAAGDSVVHLWNTSTGNRIAVPKHSVGTIRGLDFSRAGSMLAVAASSGLSVFNVRRRTFNGRVPQHNLRSVAFSPNGVTIVTGGSPHVKLWNAAARNGEPLKLAGESGAANALAFHPDGGTLAASGDDRRIALWNTRTARVDRYLEGHNSVIRPLAYSPNGAMLASGGGDGVRVWDPKAGRELRLLRQRPHFSTSLEFSRDGSKLATSGSDQSGQFTEIWDPRSGSLRRTLDGRPAVFGRDHDLYVGSKEGAVHAWNAETGAMQRSWTAPIQAVTNLAASPDGRVVASSSYQDRRFRLWDSGNGTLLHTVFGLEGTFSPNGAYFATSAPDGRVRLWNVADGKRIREWVLGPRFGEIRDVAFDPTGRYLVTANGNGTIYVLRLFDRGGNG